MPFAGTLVADHQFLTRELRESAIVPVETARIHDHSAKGIAMAGNTLGGGVHHDIGSKFNRTQQIRCGNRIIDNQRNAMLMRKIGKPFDIGNGGAWIGNRLRENRFGVWTNHRFHRREIVDIAYKITVNTEFRQKIA